MSSRNLWINLITRYGRPRYMDNLDEDMLKQAIAERRALKVISRRDGFGSGEVYFERAQVGDAIERDIEGHERERRKRYCFCIVFPQPCQITDEELSSLQQSGYAWESYGEFFEEVDWILAIKCWKRLITRYGPPLEPESLDEDTLKLAIAEHRALKVIPFGYGYNAKLDFERAQMGDAIKGYDEKREAPYFCIVFPPSCDITDEDLRDMHGPWVRWEYVREDINGILATECWKSLITRYGSPLEPESLNEDMLEQAIAEHRVFRLVRKKSSVRSSYGDLHLERAKVGDAIQGNVMNHDPDSLRYPYLSYLPIIFSRPCEITNEEVKTLEKVGIDKCWKACEFTHSTCSCYQEFFCRLPTKYSFC